MEDCVDLIEEKSATLVDSAITKIIETFSEIFGHDPSVGDEPQKAPSLVRPAPERHVTRGQAASPAGEELMERKPLAVHGAREAPSRLLFP